jgi:hypothetical protein
MEIIKIALDNDTALFVYYRVMRIDRLNILTNEEK